MSSVSDLTDRFLQIQKGNILLEDQLLGSGYIPAGYQSTVGAKTGPEGALENIANVFGLYKGDSTKDLLERAKKNRSLLVQAQKDYATAEEQRIKAEGNKTKAENRAQAALELDDTIDREIELTNRLGDITSRLQREAGDISTEQSIKQMQALFPYLDEAGRRTQARNLSASMRYRAFKEQLPSAVQDIMESKQRQQQLASDAFAREAQAIATQQTAATGFGTQGIGRYSGRRIA